MGKSRLDKSWIGVDLDRTLALYEGWVPGKYGVGQIGAPIKPMVNRVKAWLAQGEVVKIFTARVSPDRDDSEIQAHTRSIEEWCQEHLGAILQVTASKDFKMKALYDDIAWGVFPNEGELNTYRGLAHDDREPDF